MIADKTLYQEVQSAPWWIWLISGLYLGASIWLLAAYFQIAAAPFWALIIPVIVIIGFVFLLGNFSQMRVVITQKNLDVSYGWFHRTIPLNQISGVKKIKLTFLNVGGIGIRYAISGLRGLTVYNTRLGDAVQVDCHGQKRSFAFTANEIDKVVSLLSATRLK